VQACLVRELKPGDVFYDVGANAGFFSLLATKCVGERGRVFAFEPLPENIETLHEQFRLNACRNGEVVAMAVSNRSGPTTLERGPDRSTAHLAETSAAGVCGCPVQTVTLDEFIQTHARPDVIKIDVEGAEIMLLQGAMRLLSGAGRPKLLIEFHSPELAQVGSGILKSCGYRLRGLKGDACERRSHFLRHVLAVPLSI
jgi:FkbM family methyltransferase